MLGLSYGQLLLTLGAAVAFIGPKDLPIIARKVGLLAGRAIGYVQLARGQFGSIMQQSQAQQVHKELQDTMAQFDAIRHEFQSILNMNPGPLTRRLVDNIDLKSISDDNGKLENINRENNSESTVTEGSAPLLADSRNMHSHMHSHATTYLGNRKPENINGENDSVTSVIKDSALPSSGSCNMHCQATTYARLAQSQAMKNGLSTSNTEVKIDNELQLTVIPISAEESGLLPNRGADVKGSDIVLEAILEAEVAYNAKEFFSQPQNQI